MRQIDVAMRLKRLTPIVLDLLADWGASVGNGGNVGNGALLSSIGQGYEAQKGCDNSFAEHFEGFGLEVSQSQSTADGDRMEVIMGRDGIAQHLFKI